MTDGSGRPGFLSGLLFGIAAALAAASLFLLISGKTVTSSRALPAEAEDVIKANYYKVPKASALDDGSVQGMVAELRKRYKDRFSHYFSPKDLKVFNTATTGRFSGVGLTVNEVKRGLRVASPIPDAPAKQAGIRAGDLITAVEGRSIAGVSADISTARIKGPPGSQVTLTIVPAKGGGAHDVTLRRADVRVPAVLGRMREAGGKPVAYVRFATFSAGAHGELRQEIERLYAKGAQGLVLDLRGNGGGLLNEAVLCASIFVEHGTVVTTESRTRGERNYDAVGKALAPRPTVVLINRDTASAAEILTAALQTYDLATIVGTRSFGKGVFQEVIHLDAGGALDLTVGEYLTANGVSLAGKGVKPDVRGKDDVKTRADEGLAAALDQLATKLR